MRTKEQLASAKQRQFENARQKQFGLSKPDSEHAKVVKKVTKKPVYKSGMVNGQPRNYAKATKGTITSID